MLTSKQLLAKSGISRATLNNYVARGLLPKPVVEHPPEPGRGPRQIGYFPDDALARVEQIQQLKRQGYTMEEIVARLRAPEGREPLPPAPRLTEENAAARTAPTASSGEQLVLTIDQIPHAAYMVNYKFEVVWFNELAKTRMPAVFSRLAPRTEERSIFALLLAANSAESAFNRQELLRLNLALAKERMQLHAITQPLQGIPVAGIHELEQLYADIEAVRPGIIVDLGLRLEDAGHQVGSYCAYATYFREGILVILMPLGGDASELLRLLSRRDLVIRNLLSRRLPTLTELAVLVSDLQDSVKICSELPPEEYFELINQIWSTAGAVFRKYYGTHGKHVGDGMVYYFFPQPDCSYITNAVICAHEIKSAMTKISKEWQLRKKWTTELYLNTGLNEGQEWLGTFQTATTVEFAVLGDTINHTARLSDFARYGTIWATKNFVGKIPPAERHKVRFGIRRSGAEGEPIFVESTYSRLCNLVDLTGGRYEKLRDIAGLPVTEIVEVHETRAPETTP
ncbi:MAG: MerR family transcriptional regulator [Betaproteobacteria bacterium]|nr:MerR family transcriptional regulator [Betaproteobacteria bacterium]